VNQFISWFSVKQSTLLSTVLVDVM